MPHRRAAGKPKAKSRRKRNNRHTQAVFGIPFADPNDAEELFDSGSESPRMPPHGPPKGPPPPRPVNPPDDADVATRPHHGPKGPPPTGPPPKGPPPKGPPPKGPPPGSTCEPARPPASCPECTVVYDCRRCGRCLAHSAHPHHGSFRAERRHCSGWCCCFGHAVSSHARIFGELGAE